MYFNNLFKDKFIKNYVYHNLSNTIVKNSWITYLSFS